MTLEYKFTAQDLITQGRTTLEDINTIKSWLKIIDENFVPPNLQNETIVIFLLSCNNDIDLTKKTIISFYKCKKQFPDLYDDRDFNRKDIQTAINTVHMSVFPRRTEADYAIHFFQVRDPNYRNFDLVPIMKASYMLIDISVEKGPPHGLIVLIDMKEVGLMHLTKFKMGAVKKYLQFLQEGFPMQMKAIHIINGGYLIEKIMSLIKVFIKSELMSMMHIHPSGTTEELHKVIPKQYLPKDYGGDLESIEELNNRTRVQFQEMKQFWEIDERLRKEWNQ